MSANNEWKTIQKCGCCLSESCPDLLVATLELTVNIVEHVDVNDYYITAIYGFKRANKWHFIFHNRSLFPFFLLPPQTPSGMG